ncbi:MAG: class I SAM-dependent methyltransferase [candidate division Zixibacteria bacterium]|nr:class I SAM-dependent methyltransferase [candidate division Zixibacteria bacterium]
MFPESDKIEFDIEAVLRRYVPKDKLETYFRELMAANRKVNLVSRETSLSDLTRLAAESLLPLDIIKLTFDSVSYLDIGSGGGFPAIPLLMTEKINRAVLVERTVKKAAALEKILKTLLIKAEVVPKNFEELTFKKPFELITLRYIKLTDALLKKIFINLATGGFFIYYSSTELETYKNLSRLHTFTTPQGAVVKSLTLYQKK